MISDNKVDKVRPYWHVDLKWVFGINAFLCLSVGLLLFNMSVLTQRDNAIDISSTIVAGFFSKDGIDDERGIDEFRQQALVAPEEVLTPIEQFPWITISKDDALNLGAKELRLTIFRQITTPIYDKGLKGAAADFTNDPVEREKFVNQAFLLGMFTKSTHEIIWRIFIVIFAIGLISTVFATYFSAGLGRLGTLSFLLTSTSALGSVFGLILLFPPTVGDSMTTNIPSNITQIIGESLSQSYITTFVTGVLLMFIATVGKLAFAIINRSRQHSEIDK